MLQETRSPLLDLIRRLLGQTQTPGVDSGALLPAAPAAGDPAEIPSQDSVSCVSNIRSTPAPMDGESAASPRLTTPHKPARAYRVPIRLTR